MAKVYTPSRVPITEDDITTIRRGIDDSGITVEVYAALVGVCRPTVYTWFQGATKNVNGRRLKDALMIARLLSAGARQKIFPIGALQGNTTSEQVKLVAAAMRKVRGVSEP